eukprot:TRINITY_DN7138_c0_g1_i1.p1 TRINITY_DN7138_c0_g1~~TRINITY_DN7138_c0_g1_i1.p1  ORF type:complete len:268 (-),score=91.87 TRINITY_DN7138_c0_g1_i1:94-897(-)
MKETENKILGLHGYKQNANYMLKKLEKMFTKDNQFDCPEGKILHKEGERGEKGWYPLITSGSIFDEMDLPLENLPLTEDHYDIVVAFSQGNAALLMLLYSKRMTADALILISPFKLQDPKAHKYLLENPLDIPICIVTGKNDTLTPPNVSQEVAKYFKSECTFVSHPGGHFIPEKSEARKSIRDFVIKSQKRVKDKKTEGGIQIIEEKQPTSIEAVAIWLENWKSWIPNVTTGVFWNKKTCLMVALSLLTVTCVRERGWINFRRVLE